MAEIAVTVQASCEAYVALVVGDPPEVRDSVALDELEAADAIPALDGLVLDFGHYGWLLGLRVTGAVESILAPSLLEGAVPGSGVSLTEFPADDADRACRLQERETAGRRAQRAGGRHPRSRRRTRRFLLAALLRGPRCRRGAGAGRGTRRECGSPRGGVGDLQGLRGNSVRAGAPRWRRVGRRPMWSPANQAMVGRPVTQPVRRGCESRIAAVISTTISPERLGPHDKTGG
jgi:hypothetical protein